MELGLDFEDDDFVDNLDKTSQKPPLTSYNAKVCSSLWFETADVKDPDTAATVFKFRGDNSFFHKRFSDAAECYQQGLDNLPESNRCVRQDLAESLARCYMYMDKHAEALQLARGLVERATNPDMSMQALMLLQQIQCHNQDTAEEEATVKKLLTLHPFNVKYWMKLSDCYRKMYSELFPPKAGSIEYVKILTCLIRARLLIRSVRFSVGSFIKEKYKKLQEKVDKNIEELETNEDILQNAKQYLGEDIFTVDQTKDDEELPNVILQHVDFDDRWFGWAEV